MHQIYFLLVSTCYLFVFIQVANLSISMNYSVVMAAGDSITAGLGARWSYTRPTLFVYEDCGVSFATGGDEDTGLGRGSGGEVLWK